MQNECPFKNIAITVEYPWERDPRFPCTSFTLLNSEEQYPDSKELKDINESKMRNYIDLLVKEAEQNYPRSQVELANCYFQEEGVEKDPKKAVEWLEKAAHSGDFEAQTRLAGCYLYGIGTSTNYSNAVKWLQKSVDYSIPSRWQDKEQQLKNQAILGLCYLYGYGVEKDPEKAIEWLTKAAQNYKPAQVKLAACYFQGIGVTKDEAKAIQWLEKNDEFDSQRQLGFYYFNKQEYAKAIEWFEKAIEHLKPRKPSPDPFHLTLDISYLYPESSNEIKQRQGCVQAELAICHYYNKDLQKSKECLEECSLNNNGLGDLWEAYFKYLERQPAIKKINEQIGERNYWLFSQSQGITSSLRDQHIPQKVELNKCFRLEQTLKGEINLRLVKSTVAFFESNFCYEDSFFDNEFSFCQRLDVINYFFPKEIIDFLENDENNACSKVILALYYHYNNKIETNLVFLNQASDKNDIIADYQLGLHFKKLGYFDQALKHLEKLEIGTSNTYYDEKFVNKLVRSSIKEIGKIQVLKKENQHHKELHEKEKKMLSFFTHTMRNALATAPESLRQAIRLLGSEDYESNQKHYEAINEITALFSTLTLIDCLIDTFKQSIYDTEEFKLAWKNDNAGDATPEWFIAAALRQSLNRIIFMEDATGLRKLINNQGELIKPTRKAFIEQVLPLDANQRDVEKFYHWLQSMTALEVTIEKSTVQFGANQVKFSLMFAISSELILNALKYWSGTGKIQVDWRIEPEHYLFSVKNSCKANASSQLASTHKGLAFINRLIELLGKQAQFNCSANEQLFSAELKLHKTLLEG